MRPGKGRQSRKNPDSGKVYTYVGILCPYCGDCRSVVKDSRYANDQVRRRRVCANGHCFTTHETTDPIETSSIVFYQSEH